MDPWLKNEAWAVFEASRGALRTLLPKPHCVVTSANSPEMQGLSAPPPTSGRSLASQIFIPIPKKGNAKECSNYHTIALISHASKVMLKILQARLHQYVNRELLDVQAGFTKGKGTRDQIANIHWIIKKAREFQKT